MRKSEYTRHLLTAKHKNASNDLQKDLQETYIDLQNTYTPENTKKIKNYICDCGREYKHRQSLNKHKQTCVKKNTEKNTENTKCEDGKYPCDCGNIYNSRSALWYHKKKCTHHIEIHYNSSPPENIVHESITDTTLLKCFQTMMETQSNAMQMQLTQSAAQSAAQAAAIEQAAVIQAKRDEAAAEQTKLLIEAITLNGPKTIMNNNNSNNTTNNQFNLNVFLNEDCKDAFTLKEVMESIECTVSDLDRMDHDGYAATITRKILESMQDMLITERPIHCTDSRRNTVCVKNETGWEKNDKAMKLLMDSVYFVGRNLGGMIQDWQKAYPDHYHGTESRRKQYHRLVDDVMSVIDKSVEAQIASKVCKGIVLDRKTAMDR